MALYRAVKSYDESRGASFTTYAVACISNALVNFVKRYNTLCVPFGKTEEINDDIPESDTTDGIVFSNNLSNMLYVMKGFANLSENERNVLVMKLGGFKNKEISEKTGKTPKSVDNTLFRARKKLRDYLGL